jgi:hypothetical protein
MDMPARGSPPFLAEPKGVFTCKLGLVPMDKDFKTNEDIIRIATEKLMAHCRANEWAGYDPYDALNSKIFTALPLLDHRIPRLVFTQVLKRMPVNLRWLLAIPKTQNPKALALFLSAFIKLSKLEPDRERELHKLIHFMIERLIALRSTGVCYSCWGYSFPWQTRTIVVPAGAPNLVCTTFVANALFDAFDYCGDSTCLNTALSASEYILNELYWTKCGIASFSYPLASVCSQVHNANFLAAALLGRAYSNTGDVKFLLPALKVARCSADKQQANGSWYYGEKASQRWIDNFHSGYNLCALRDLSRHAATTEFDHVIRRGFEFYRLHFIGLNGTVHYFHNQLYPIDIHCVAQSIITLLTFNDMAPDSLPLAHSVFNWTLAHMWDDRGFFYYRILRSHTNRISYMRWSQAWMLLAMAMLQGASASVQRGSSGRLAEVAPS